MSAETHRQKKDDPGYFKKTDQDLLKTNHLGPFPSDPNRGSHIKPADSPSQRRAFQSHPKPLDPRDSSSKSQTPTSTTKVDVSNSSKKRLVPKSASPVISIHAQTYSATNSSPLRGQNKTSTGLNDRTNRGDSTRYSPQRRENKISNAPGVTPARSNRFRDSPNTRQTKSCTGQGLTATRSNRSRISPSREQNKSSTSPGSPHPQSNRPKDVMSPRQNADTFAPKTTSIPRLDHPTTPCQIPPLMDIRIQKSPTSAAQTQMAPIQSCASTNTADTHSPDLFEPTSPLTHSTSWSRNPSKNSQRGSITPGQNSTYQVGQPITSQRSECFVLSPTNPLSATSPRNVPSPMPLLHAGNARRPFAVPTTPTSSLAPSRSASSYSQPPTNTSLPHPSSSASERNPPHPPPAQRVTIHAAPTSSMHRPNSTPSGFHQGRASALTHASLLESLQFAASKALYLLSHPNFPQDQVFLSNLHVLHHQIIHLAQSSRSALPPA
nr:mucin-2-like [Lytechinus pictus]